MAEVEKVFGNPEVIGYVLKLDPEEAADLYAVLNSEGDISDARVVNEGVYAVMSALASELSGE